MRKYDSNFSIKINIHVGQYDYLMSEHHSWYIGSVWHKDWDQVYVGHWPIFYDPVILFHILKTIWWRNVVFGIMDQCDTKIDLLKYMWVSDLYFMGRWFCLYYCYRLKLFVYIKKWHRLGVFVPLQALALIWFQYVLEHFRLTDLEGTFYFLLTKLTIV